MREYALGIYEKAMPNFLSLEEKLQLAKKYGYDYVEISIDETSEKLERLDWDKEYIDRLVNNSKKIGLEFRSMCLSGQRKYPMGSLDENVRAKSMQIIKKAIILANELGVRIIQLAGYDVYYEKGNEQTKKLFLENLKIATDFAAKYGIILAFETMETEFMDTVSKARQVVEYINSPFLKIYPDLGNIKNSSLIYGHDVLDDIRSGGKNIVAAHIKESIVGHYREIPFLTGHVNFKDCLEVLWDLGVRRFVTEFWYVGANDYEKDIKFASETFSKMLDDIQKGEKNC